MNRHVLFHATSVPRSRNRTTGETAACLGALRRPPSAHVLGVAAPVTDGVQPQPPQEAPLRRVGRLRHPVDEGQKPLVRGIHLLKKPLQTEGVAWPPVGGH